MPTVWPGEPFPMGATYDGTGTSFSVFSEVADAIEVCLFDDDGTETRVELPETTAYVHHGHLPGVRDGQRYGFRVHGPWKPSDGHRCNPNKLLLDPYGKAVEGRVDWNSALFAYDPDDPDIMDESDSAPYMPKSVVANPYFDWGDDRLPRTPLHDSLIYETHVKGLTALHPDVPEEMRGTYAAVAHPAVVEHFHSLGVTAVELMPVHQFIHDHFLAEKGLRNYWGYNSIAYLAPHDEYASAKRPGEQVTEFKAMVRDLHAAGIEVILDVVYNHTAEGNHLGPTLSLRGIDNAAYYRLVSEDPRHYVDYTGTGNSLNMRHPNVLQLIMDSLRYWVLEMHVDGFRFDLAATLARELHDVDRLSAFFDIIQQDPVISQVKLIAEPWDVGEGGYQVGNFPPLWSEWNGKYRDGVRDYWRGADETLADFANRLTGSSDLYETTGRRPTASINFVTAHDGFPLADLVSYNDKHNEANGEDSRDGTDDNRSWNSGVEGPTDDPEITALRGRRARSMLTTLLLSQGVPMLLGGDELGRSQGGNNNGYAQDNEVSWYDWESIDEEMLEFTRRLTALHFDHPVFRRRRWFEGSALRGSDVTDIVWFTPDGTEMTEQDWNTGYARSLAVYLDGKGIPSPDPRGLPVVDDDFLLLFNAYNDSVEFIAPPELGGGWSAVIDTAQAAEPDGPDFDAGSSIEVIDHSVVVLRRSRPE